MNFPYTRIAGTVSYVRHDGFVRGREWFSLHAHANGNRVVRAECEMVEEKLVRDTSWSLDPQWRPMEGYVRITLDGVVAGSTWYTFSGNTVHCEARTPVYGRASQVRTSPTPYEFLGLHPLIGDGLICAIRGRDQPGVERRVNSITCSYSPNGEKELLALPIEIGVTYLAPERITVPAGTFDAHKYAISWRKEWPPADYWVFGDHYTFLKETWSVSDMTCELMSLEQTTADA